MTTNQLKRLEIELNREINAAKNAETARSNRANERITSARDLRGYRTAQDSNQISREHYHRMDNETQRANLAKEAENTRSNVAREIETSRANKASEAEKQRSNLANEAINTRRADIAESQVYNQLIAARNANRIANRQADLAEDRLALDEATRGRELDIKQEELDWRESYGFEDHFWDLLGGTWKRSKPIVVPW